MAQEIGKGELIAIKKMVKALKVVNYDARVQETLSIIDVRAQEQVREATAHAEALEHRLDWSLLTKDHVCLDHAEFKEDPEGEDTGWYCGKCGAIL